MLQSISLLTICEYRYLGFTGRVSALHCDTSERAGASESQRVQVTVHHQGSTHSLILPTTAVQTVSSPPITTGTRSTPSIVPRVPCEPFTESFLAPIKAQVVEWGKRAHGDTWLFRDIWRLASFTQVLHGIPCLPRLTIAMLPQMPMPLPENLRREIAWNMVLQNRGEMGRASTALLIHQSLTALEQARFRAFSERLGSGDDAGAHEKNNSNSASPHSGVKDMGMPLLAQSVRL